MKLLLTRHAQTTNNADSLIHDENKPAEITEKGFVQIKNLIGRLQKEKISKIICSNRERCKKTAEEITRNIPLKVEYEPLIREKENGDLGGMKQGEVKWDELEGDFENRKAPNGESLIEARERGRQFFRKIMKKYKDSDEKILVVSHGAFLKIFIGDLLGMSLHDSVFKLFIEHCSLTEIEINSNNKEGYRINYINEHSYH